MFGLSISFVLAIIGVAVAYPGPGAVSGDTAVHDPTMCKDSSGTYFVFSTGVGIEIRTSTDRTAFTRVGVAFPDGAEWTDDYTGESNGSLWAPDCTYIDGTFHLYYSASSFGSNKSGIFYATSTTGQPGSFTNQGLITSTSTSSNYNAIDPNLLITGNSWYLSLGSFWSGIKQVSLDSSDGTVSGSVDSLATRTENSGAVEASAVYEYDGYFYLFTSWDTCCSGTSSTYNIRVGRSSSVDGTYVDADGVSLLEGGGTVVLETHDSIVGPGGQDIFTDGDGPVLVYHYYTSSGSYLGINLLDFSSGWPVAY